MRIAHVSDLHIRNWKYKREYESAFEDLYEKLDTLKPDLIVNTGDTVHSKTAVSPELFDTVARHMSSMCDIAPYWVILGNHDLNLKNKDRMDAISPVVRALQGKTRHELRIPEAGETEQMLGGCHPEFIFHNYDIRQPDLKPVPLPGYINVGLYHGSISGCVTDIGFTMEDGESEVSRFGAMDFVLMGDIHKRQSFRSGRMHYPGSLIQQNYGEEPVKGFLLWDIKEFNDFSVDFHAVEAPGRFFTIQVPADMSLDGITVPPGSHIRVSMEGELTPSKRVELEKSIREAFKPLDIITPDPSSVDNKAALEIEQLTGDRETLIRGKLVEQKVDEDLIDEVVALWNEYSKEFDDDAARGTTWELKRLAWDNVVNYGEGNFIEMEKLDGIVGIFAPNRSGKSSIFDVMLESLFDKTSKDVPKNIDLINDNKDKATMSVQFESAGQAYDIDRTIERISYGQRKLAETKQWGKTSLDFKCGDEELNGDSRPETERAIRGIIGSFEDFTLTTMVTQNPIFGLPGGGDIINCKETDRRKILFRFLDLDIYEKVNASCKDGLKGILGSLKGSSAQALETDLAVVKADLKVIHTDIEAKRTAVSDTGHILGRMEETRESFGASNVIILRANLRRAEAEQARLEASFSRGKHLVTSLSGDIEFYQSKLVGMESIRPDRPDMSLEDVSEKMEMIREDLEQTRLELSKKKDELARGKKALKTLDGVPCEGKYPTCKFIAEASEFIPQRELLEQAIGQLNTADGYSDHLLSDLTVWQIRHADVAKWEHDVTTTKLKIEELRGKVLVAENVLAGVVTELQMATAVCENATKLWKAADDGTVTALDVEILGRQTLLKSLKADLEQAIRRVGALEATEVRMEKELAHVKETSEKVRAHELLSELTGKSGLPYQVLGLVLPAINAEINKFLNGVVGFSVFFEDNHEDQTISLYIRYGDYKSRPLSLGSGAEKFFGSLAVRVGLLSVSSLPKTDFLIIDEGFGKLDPELLEALQKMFEYLREAFRTVFIISHVDSLRDVVDHTLDITSQEGYAHVEVG